MGADDCLHDLSTERQMELGIPARFVPERATPKTAGELIQQDAADREQARRRLQQIKEGLVPLE